jgi:transposase
MEEHEFIFYDDDLDEAWYCGLDVHKHKLAVALYSKDVKDENGLKTAIFSVDADGLSQFWNFVKKYRPLGFAMEATGIYHHLPHKFLREKQETSGWKYDLVVVNPADAAGIPGRNKNDKIDSKNLAKYLANGLLKNGKPIIEILEDFKSIFRMRKRLTRDTTALKNRIKKNLDRAGLRMKKLDLSTIWVCTLLYHFVRQKAPLGTFLRSAIKAGKPLEKHRNIIKKNMAKFEPYFPYSLTPAQRILIRQALIELDFKTARIEILKIEIDQMLLEYPLLRRHAYNLASIPGISKTSAVWILAEIGNINQFKTYRNFVAYCGCCPRVVSSADKIYSAHASRHSNVYLRKIFYSAAHVLCSVVKKDSELKRYARRVYGLKSKYSKKLAYYTVATKIARVAFALLRNETAFIPNY